MPSRSSTSISSYNSDVSTQEQLTALVVEFYQELSRISVREGRPVSIDFRASVAELDTQGSARGSRRTGGIIPSMDF